MKIRFTKKFQHKYKKLPYEIQKKTDDNLLLFKRDSNYPSLKIKKMKGHQKIWEGRITRKYRFTFCIKNDVYILRNIGTHDILQKP